MIRKKKEAITTSAGRRVFLKFTIGKFFERIGNAYIYLKKLHYRKGFEREVVSFTEVNTQY